MSKHDGKYTLAKLGKTVTGVNPCGTRAKASTLVCGGEFPSFLEMGSTIGSGGLPPFLDPFYRKRKYL